MTPEIRNKLKEIEHAIRDITNTVVVDVDVEFEDEFAAFVLAECARRDLTPSELVEFAIRTHMKEQG